MSEGLPIITIVLAVILVVVALIVLRIWVKQRGKFEQPIVRNKKAFFAQFIIGLILVLTAGFFMFDGDILGDNTTGISTVIGIVGICLVATSNIYNLPSLKRK